jgi:hypothetical protein
MLRSLNKSAARLLLAVMLMTFLAPGFGWQANATHDEIALASAHDHDHDRDHHHDSDASHHDDDAHGAIGHVLGHLPAFLSAATVVAPPAPGFTHFAEVRVQWPRVSLDPPLRPPRYS